MKVLPALLTSSVEDLFQQIHKCSRYYSYFQIDIADGEFVPNSTISINDMHTYLESEHTSSIYHSCIFDFHLMVINPEEQIEQLVDLQKAIPIKHVFIHQKLKPPLKTIMERFSEFTIGLVLNPEDSVNDLVHDHPLNSIPAIQIMSVNPGFQGNPFMEETLDKIEQLRKNNYKYEIFLDGGVNDKTLPVIKSKSFVPDYVSIGSYISQAENLKERVKEIETLI
jgi:ribulose-phosphate 3-epimerase